MLLRDKSVVIMGAGSGVGRAASLIFARNGARLVCADVVADRAEETAALVAAEGFIARPFTCDVRNEAQVAATIAAAVSSHGRLDVIYNNVGVGTTTATGQLMAFDEMDDSHYQFLADVNLRGMINGCRHAIRQFLAQGDRQGVIVNTGSVAGLVGWGGTVYGATKAGGIQLTRGLAIEYARHGIRVNVVCPGGMATNFGAPEGQSHTLSNEQLAYMSAAHPLGRVIDPEDTANAALFLASDLARNITGVVIPVDGGYTAA
jgi:NAD(P)-dependent dehydrogenase (short-subunit alcohol dehydrogenase family)